MTNPSNSAVQNLLPVQAYFNLDGSFNTFIGQGVAFYAIPNPNQSGLNITNSTINSTTIGATTPSTGVFTNIDTTTGTISTNASSGTDIVNLLTLQAYGAGITWKNPVTAATTVNITLSGTQTVDGVVLVAGNTVLVKNQSNTAQNGIYKVNAGAWTYAIGSTTWDQYVSALVFVEYGSQTGSAWYCTAQPGGTLGTTAMTWSAFSTAASYTAGTGLTLAGYQFSITNTGVAATTYGSATASPVFAVNAQGQITSVTNTTITPALGSITGFGTGVATALAINTGTAGAFVVNGGALGTPSSGTLTNCTFPTLNQNTTGYAAGLAGGLAGSLPYQSAVNATTFLAAGSNGQVLTLAAGLPSWATPTTGTVTSVSGTGTVNGITLTGTVTSTGSLTLGGTLGSIANSQLTNSSITFGATAAALGTTVSGFNAVSIGATTASTGAFTYLSTSSTTSTTPVLGFNASNCSFASGATVSGTYLQAVMQNKSGTAGASTNLAVSNDLGTDSTYYGEFGMNSSIFSASTPSDFFSINNGVYFSGHDGDISYGSGNGFKTYLAWGTTGQSAHVINATGAIGLSTNLGTTPATSGTSGFGTAGYLMQTQGSGAAPTWVAQSSIAAGSASTATTATNATNVGVTDDTTTATSVYPAWVTTTTGNLPIKTASTKLSFVPSTGVLSATSFAGAGTGLTGTASSLSIGGNAATATTSTNLTGGASGSLPYQSGAGATTFLAAGTNGYVLTLAAGVPTWAASTGGVTSFSAGTTGFTPSSSTTGAITLAGTLNAVNGGTAQSTYTTGDILYASASNTLSKLAVGSTGQVLTVASGIPSWATASAGGGITWQSVQTTAIAATAGSGYPVNTTSAAITATLPASPSAGNIIIFTDYAGTFATNKLTINPNGNKFNGSTSNALVATNRESIAIVYVDATQGWIAYSGFNDSTPAQSYTASYLTVAGGGSGGTGGNSAGGGAGGLLSGTTTLTPGTTYTVVVGAGGASPGSTAQGNSGSNSSITGLTASVGGGGGGCASATVNGLSGGSGGGAGGGGASGTGGSATSGQGFAGGNNPGTAAPNFPASGGGGAGAVGVVADNVNAGAGGAGAASSITGSSVTYAGGGGGGSNGTGASGGSGGGGTGASYNVLAATAGTVNTGSGGGGGTGGATAAGGAGGSGVVILSVPTANYSGTTTGSPTVTTSGSNTIIKYTASGSYTG
jgi:hypothetical protein